MINIVNTVNDQTPNNHYELLTYQTSRLQTLIKEIQQCCEDRKLYERDRFGLPYAELQCLLLFNGARYLTVKSLSEKLEVAKSRVTKLVNDLVKKGMAEKIDDPKDSRIKLINLTHTGLKISKEIQNFHREIHRKILIQMNEDERKGVISNLELLRSTMESVKEELN